MVQTKQNSMNLPTVSLNDLFEKVKKEFSSYCEPYWDKCTEVPQLRDVMIYSACDGGKRMRALLAFAVGDVFGVSQQVMIPAAVAIEFVHAYSLVHDDLPAMDNGYWRRGKPSCWRQFSEALAILGGDALMTLGFEILAEPMEGVDPRLQLEAVNALAKAIGPNGMAGGQVMDIQMVGNLEQRGPITEEVVRKIELLKTGKLLIYACEVGAILGQASPLEREALRKYGYHLGVLFQVTDDLLDLEGKSTKMGKETGQDKDKTTLVSLFGAQKARVMLAEMRDQADECLEIFGEKARVLHEITKWILARDY